MAKAGYCLFCGSELSQRKIEGKEYLACPSENCEFVHWDNPLPVVAAIVEHGGNVLLARNKAWPPKMFGLITGFLEKGEDPEEAVLREVREELGLRGSVESMVGLYSFPERNQLIIAYHVSAAGGITLSDELAEITAVAPEKLRPWGFGTGLAIRDWLEKRGRHE